MNEWLVNNNILYYDVIYIYIKRLQTLQFQTCSPSHEHTNCSTVHNQSGSLIKSRACLSSSEHTLTPENPQFGQECEVDKSQAHQHIFQRVKHRSYKTEHSDQSDSEDEKREVLQSESSEGRQRVVGSDGRAQSGQEGEDVDWEHPGRAKHCWFPCHSHHLHRVQPEQEALHKHLCPAVPPPQEAKGARGGPGACGGRVQVGRAGSSWADCRVIIPGLRGQTVLTSIGVQLVSHGGHMLQVGEHRARNAKVRLQAVCCRWQEHNFSCCYL